jgi:hypothetical protein
MIQQQLVPLVFILQRFSAANQKKIALDNERENFFVYK